MCGITAVLSRRSPVDPRTMLAGMASLHEGQKVSFEMQRDNRSGKMAAADLRAV